MTGGQSHRQGAIGIFGGTFDPIHNAHLLMAECAYEDLGLDFVYFVPAAIPPHKRDGRTVATAAHRLAMVRLAIEGNSHFTVLTWELDRGHVSYTVDTLEFLAGRHPDRNMFLLLGADSVRDFPSWHRPDRITELARIAVIGRPGVELSADVMTGVSYRRVSSPLIDISSSDLRRRASEGKSLRYRTPEAVVDYIERNGLYRSP